MSCLDYKGNPISKGDYVNFMFIDLVGVVLELESDTHVIIKWVHGAIRHRISEVNLVESKNVTKLELEDLI